MPRKLRFVIKRLDLEPWMHYDNDADLPEFEPLLGSDRYPEIRPIVGRPGYYYSRPFLGIKGRAGPLCWIEIDGRAYRAPAEDWEYSFATLSASEINARQADALHHIISEGLATRDQKTLFTYWLASENLREGRRGARLWYLRNFPKNPEYDDDL